MNKINVWKYKNEWIANRIFAKDSITSEYTANIYGRGKTKGEAINSLCDALMTLSEEIKGVVHEVNINKL